MMMTIMVIGIHQLTGEMSGSVVKKTERICSKPFSQGFVMYTVSQKNF